MAKTYERLLSKNILREKGRDSFDPQRVNLLGEDCICTANLLVIPQKIVVFLQIKEQELVCSRLKKAKISKRLLSLITAKRKDRHLFGGCLCSPWISCLCEAIQI